MRMDSLKLASQADTFCCRFADKSFTNLSHNYGSMIHQNMWGPLAVWSELTKGVLQVMVHGTRDNTQRRLQPTAKYSSQFKESDIFAKNLKTGKANQLTRLKGMERKPRIADGRVLFRAISWTTKDLAYFMIDLKAAGY